MRVSSIQWEVRDSDSKNERLNRMAKLVDSCRGSQLIVLPETWKTGYFDFDRYEQESEGLQGETVSLLAAKAKSLNAYIVTGSFIEKDGDKLYNTTVLLNPQGENIATYRKIHLFGYGSEETRLITPGREVVTAQTEFGVVGLATCYDLRFPELFRKMLDQGVQIILISSAWPYPRLDHWRMLNHVRALENECYLISANCSGISRGKQFLGHSAVIDPWGVMVAGAGDEETVLITEIDPAKVDHVRKVFPPVTDRVLF